MSHFASLPPADRFALIIEGLRQAVARRGGGLGRLPGPLLILIWTRLRRYAARFARYAATPTPSRLARPHPARPRRAGLSPLPRRKAWLLRLMPETATCASQLSHFLNEPDVASLLQDAPQLGRVLRPLCRMLNI